MNFRKWLAMLETATPSSAHGVKSGPGYGGPRTMLPVSLGFDNRAMASLLGGVGEARAKIRARKGAEPGDAPHFDPLENIRKTHITHVYMPLQLDAAWVPGEPQRKSASKNYIDAIRASVSPDPLKDTRVYNSHEKNGSEIVNLDSDPKGMRTRLYTFSKGGGEDAIDFENAVFYTQALMHASFVTRLNNYAHLLDLYRPITKDRQFLPVEIETGPLANPSDPQFCKVMVWAVEFDTTKNSQMGRDVYADIEDALGGRPRSRPSSSSSSAPPPPPPPASSSSSGP